MEMIFKAQKMIDRIKREGRENLLDEDTIKFIWKLDGKRGNDYNWQSFVHGDDVVWIEKDEEQNGAYVARCDCVYPEED